MPLRGVRDRVYMLKSLPSFARLDEESLTLMAEHAHVRRFRKGQVLIREDESIRAIYLVIDGEIRVTYLGELVAMVPRSRGVGLLAVLARQDSGTGAVAAVDSHVLEIPVEAVNEAYEESFPIVRNALRLCSGGLVRNRGNLPMAPDPNRTIDEGKPHDRELTLVERVLEMRSLPLFRRANVDAVVEFVRQGKEVRYQEGERLWSVGDPSTFQLRLDCGRVTCTAADGHSVDVGARFILGNLDSLAMTPRSYEAVATKPVIAYRTDIQGWLSVMETHHDLARGLLAIFATSLLEEQRAAHRKETSEAAE
jgi:CRP-like cAMP-binding protein